MDIRTHGWLRDIRQGHSGYVVVDVRGNGEHVMWGFGRTRAAAWKNSRFWRNQDAVILDEQGHAIPDGNGTFLVDPDVEDDTDDLACYPCTPLLYDETGDTAWRLLDGVMYRSDEPTVEEWAEQLARACPVPNGAEDWAKQRVQMLAAMALAAAEGNPRVALTAEGVIWSDMASASAANRALSPRRATALRQMNANLPGWNAKVEEAVRREAARYARRRREIEEIMEQVTRERRQRDRQRRRDRLREIGEAVFGAEWIAPTAEAMGWSVRTVQRWASGERDEAPPENALSDLEAALQPHIRACVARLETRLETLKGLTQPDVARR